MTYPVYNMTIGIIGWVFLVGAILFDNAGLAAIGFLFVTQLNAVNFGI